jgi:hypothetical protein
VLLQKEGESLKDTAVQSRSGASGKRVIGKAVAKGGLLLKGKNPGNVSLCCYPTGEIRQMVDGGKCGLT